MKPGPVDLAAAFLSAAALAVGYLYALMRGDACSLL